MRGLITLFLAVSTAGCWLDDDQIDCLYPQALQPDVAWFDGMDVGVVLEIVSEPTKTSTPVPRLREVRPLTKLLEERVRQ